MTIQFFPDAKSTKEVPLPRVLPVDEVDTTVAVVVDCGGLVLSNRQELLVLFSFFTYISVALGKGMG